MKNLAQASEAPITIPTVSNHLGFLKDDSRKPGNCENSSYEQALRHFYIGIERVNTHVD